MRQVVCMSLAIDYSYAYRGRVGAAIVVDDMESKEGSCVVATFEELEGGVMEGFGCLVVLKMDNGIFLPIIKGDDIEHHRTCFVYPSYLRKGACVC